MTVQRRNKVNDGRTKQGRAAAMLAAQQGNTITLNGATGVTLEPLASAPKSSETANTADPVAKTHRRKRASVGGFQLKLDAPQRAGFVRRFVKNDPSRIMRMQELGYDFAEADTRTDDLGTRITRHAGKGEFGQPEHLVLMETPEDQYAIGVAEKEEQRLPFEQALRAGHATDGELTNRNERTSQGSLTHSGG